MIFEVQEFFPVFVFDITVDVFASDRYLPARALMWLLARADSTIIRFVCDLISHYLSEYRWCLNFSENSRESHVEVIVGRQKNTNISLEAEAVNEIRDNLVLEERRTIYDLGERLCKGRVKSKDLNICSRTASKAKKFYRWISAFEAYTLIDQIEYSKLDLFDTILTRKNFSYFVKYCNSKPGSELRKIVKQFEPLQELRKRRAPVRHS